jgi:hypothetical protein
MKIMVFTKIQKNILYEIQEEYGKPKQIGKPSPWRTSIYFYPKMGVFLFNDEIVPYDEILQLIDGEILYFVRIEKHQGILMLRYDILKEYRS